MQQLENICVVLVQTRFPENVGSVARACANMGCHDLRLAAPERWDPLKGAPLATRAGLSVLDNIKIFPTLSQAIGDCHMAIGTSARSGRWRKCIFNPRQASAEILLHCNAGEKTALVFGPEDRGLSNPELALCKYIIHIPTEAASSSLNLAQAVLLILYECANAKITMPPSIQNNSSTSKITITELEILERELKLLLAKNGCLNGKNPSHAFQQWHDMLTRAQLRRHEFSALMGLCRQLKHNAPNNEKD